MSKQTTNKTSTVKEVNRFNPMTWNWSRIYWNAILVIIIAFALGATWQYLQTFMQDKPDAAAIVSGVVVFLMANVLIIAFNKVK